MALSIVNIIVYHRTLRQISGKKGVNVGDVTVVNMQRIKPIYYGKRVICQEVYDLKTGQTYCYVDFTLLKTLERKTK